MGVAPPKESPLRLKRDVVVRRVGDYWVAPPKESPLRLKLLYPSR